MVGRLGRSLGEILLALMLCASVFLVMWMAIPISTNLTGGEQEVINRRVVFDKEGMPRIEIREYAVSTRRRRRMVTWYDVEHNKIGTFPDHKAPRLRLGGFFDFNEVMREGWRKGRRADLTGWRYLPAPGEQEPIWHLLPYRGLMTGYVYPFGRHLGYLGREGFIPPGGTGPGFDDPRKIATIGKLGDIWVDGRRIYAVNLDQRTVIKFWESPDAPIRAVGVVGNMGVVLCGNTLRVIDWTRRVRLEAELPEPLRRNVAWRAAWLKDRLVLCNLAFQRATVCHIGTDGELIGEPLKVRVPASGGLRRAKRIVLSVAATVMSPWAGIALDKFLLWAFPNVHRLFEAWFRWPYDPTYFAISLALTLISTVLGWWHLRLRSSVFQMCLGLSLTLLFSWPGFLVCLTLFDVASRVPCPTCSRPRPADRETCPHCKAPWPAPPLTGCEILLPP